MLYDQKNSIIPVITKEGPPGYLVAKLCTGYNLNALFSGVHEGDGVSYEERVIPVDSLTIHEWTDSSSWFV